MIDICTLSLGGKLGPHRMPPREMENRLADVPCGICRGIKAIPRSTGFLAGSSAV